MNCPKLVRYVDHSYSDYSCYVEQGGALVKHKKSTNNFPARLHRILSNPDYSDAITWMPHGRAFKIINKERFIRDIIPKYYVSKKFETFARQLNGWGFKRLHQTGPDFGCYYNECLLRDRPKLTCLIRRLPSNTGKSAPAAKSEPNFYWVSEQYPLLPLQNDTLDEESLKADLASLDLAIAENPSLSLPNPKVAGTDAASVNLPKANESSFEATRRVKLAFDIGNPNETSLDLSDGNAASLSLAEVNAASLDLSIASAEQTLALERNLAFGLTIEQRFVFEQLTQGLFDFEEGVPGMIQETPSQVLGMPCNSGIVQPPGENNFCSEIV